MQGGIKAYHVFMQTLPISKVKDRLNELVDAAATTREQVTITKNGSPAADTPPALLVYDAELELVSARGSRRVPYDRFHSGYKVMDLRNDEIIRSIALPRGRRSWIQTYRKICTRNAQANSKV